MARLKDLRSEAEAKASVKSAYAVLYPFLQLKSKADRLILKLKQQNLGCNPILLL
jgi:hypothetical protein